MNHRKNMPSPVDRFRVDGKVYFHKIFCSDDDRVECTDEDGKLILIFTADCDALAPDGKRIGRWATENGNWAFRTSSNNYAYGRDLLKAEVEISKLYIRGELEAA